jgi:hypothetical protein
MSVSPADCPPHIINTSIPKGDGGTAGSPSLPMSLLRIAFLGGVLAVGAAILTLELRRVVGPGR